MPVVDVVIFKGKSYEQKSKMVARVTEAFVETLNCPKEAVTIIIREIDPDCMANAGVLRSESK